MKKLDNPIILFFLFLLMFAAVYSPVLYFDYLFHDDSFFWVKLKGFVPKHYLYDLCISICRYGYAFLLNIENLFVHQISDLKCLRFLGIVISGFNALLLLQQLRRLSFSDIQAFLIVSALFFLPGFASSFSNASYSTLIALCIFLASWSFHRIDTGKKMVFPLLYLFLSITIYPPAAMFYWVMLANNILFTRDRYSVQFRNKLWRAIAVGIMGIVIYAISIFLMHFSFSHKIYHPLHNPYKLSYAYFNKLQWFLHEPLENALNLWKIYPNATVSTAVSGFIALTSFITLIRKLILTEARQRKKTALTCLWQSGLFIALLLMAFLPNLAAEYDAAYYRCLIPLTSLIWLLLVWAVFKWVDIIPRILTQWTVAALLATVVVYAGIKTFDNTLYYRALPSYVEWNAYQTMAGVILSHKVDAIHISIPDYPSFDRYDEFGSVTSQYDEDLYYLLYCALKETGKQGIYFLPSIYVTKSNDSRLYQLNDLYITRSPDGKLLVWNLDREDQFYKTIHSLSINRNTHETPWLLPNQKTFPKRQNWYNLDLNDYFDPVNYQKLIF